MVKKTFLFFFVIMFWRLSLICYTKMEGTGLTHSVTILEVV